MMSTGQRGYANVQKHNSYMSGYAVLALSFTIFKLFGASHGDVAMRYVDCHVQLNGAKFGDRYAHWCGDN